MFLTIIVLIGIDGQMPSWSVHDYSSSNALSSDEIDISVSDQPYKTHCSNGGVSNRRLSSSKIMPPSIDAVSTIDRRNQRRKFNLQDVSNCKVLIGVYGTIGSEYSLTITSSSSATLLQLGVTQTGTVGEGLSKLYRTVITDQSTYTLRLTLTPQSGHVSMYVSCSSESPNATNYLWAISPALTSGSYIGKRNEHTSMI